MKKIIALLLCAIVVAGVFAGCGNNQNAADGTKPQGNGGSNTDITTELYLAELIAANYNGSQALHDRIYAWNVSIVANNSSTSMDDQSTVDGKKTCYFHFTLTGGRPNETIPVYAKVRYPGGNSDKADYNEMKHGQSEYFYFNSWGNYPKGNCTITIYNADTNAVLGTHSVKLT